MRVSKRVVILLSCLSMSFFGATNVTMAQAQAKRGAVLGGLSGAAIGAIIGDNSDEAGAGAAIGGAVGAVAGTILGNANQEQYGNAGPYGAPIYRTQPRYVGPGPGYSNGANYVRTVPVTTLSSQDIIALTHSRVSDSVIISEIQTKGLSGAPSVQDIVFLSQQGVSDVVIRAMQNAGRPAPVVVASPPVVVKRYPSAGRYYYGPPHRGGRYYPSNAYRGRSGVNISFGTRY